MEPKTLKTGITYESNDDINRQRGEQEDNKATLKRLLDNLQDDDFRSELMNDEVASQQSTDPNLNPIDLKMQASDKIDSLYEAVQQRAKDLDLKVDTDENGGHIVQDNVDASDYLRATIDAGSGAIGGVGQMFGDVWHGLNQYGQELQQSTESMPAYQRGIGMQAKMVGDIFNKVAEVGGPAYQDPGGEWKAMQLALAQAGEQMPRNLANDYIDYMNDVAGYPKMDRIQSLDFIKKLPGYASILKNMKEQGIDPDKLLRDHPLSKGTVDLARFGFTGGLTEDPKDVGTDVQKRLKARTGSIGQALVTEIPLLAGLKSGGKIYNRLTKGFGKLSKEEVKALEDAVTKEVTKAPAKEIKVDAVEAPHKPKKSAQQSAKVFEPEKSRVEYDADMLARKSGIKNPKQVRVEVKDDGKVVLQYRERGPNRKEWQEIQPSDKALEASKRTTPSTRKAAVGKRKELPDYVEPSKPTKAKSSPVKEKKTFVHVETPKGIAVYEAKKMVGKTAIETEAGTVSMKKVKKIVNEEGKPVFLRDKKKLQAKREELKKQAAEERQKTKEERVTTMEEAGVPKEQAAQSVRNHNVKLADDRLTNSYKFFLKTRTSALGHTVFKGSQRMKQFFLDDVAEAMNTRKSLIRMAQDMENNAKQEFAHDLGIASQREAEAMFARYNLWDRGITPKDYGLTGIEETAFKNLKANLTEANVLNRKILKEDLGISADEAYWVTSAKNGGKEFRADVTDVPQKELDKAGVKTFEFEGRKYATLDFYDSEKDFLRRWEGEVKGIEDTALDVKTIYPFLYDESGKLKNYSTVRNIHQAMLDLTENDKLTFEQLKGIKGQLDDAGYNKAEVKSLMEDIASNNIDGASKYSRAYRMFVGSLKERQGTKLGFAKDPVRAVQNQVVQLSTKVMRDNVVPKLRDIIVKELEPEIEKLEGKPIDLKTGVKADRERWKQIQNLKAQKFAFEMLELDLRNMPDPMTKWLRQNYPGAQKMIDKAFYANTVAKLMASGTVVMGNTYQAAAYALTNMLENPKILPKLAGDFGPKNYWKGVRKVLDRMDNGRYGEIYKDIWQDASVDTSFIRRKGKDLISSLATTGRDIVMMPTSASIKAGQAYMYRVAELTAESKGLTGKAADDFILETLSEAGQVSPMNAFRAGRVPPIRAATHLQNFIIQSVNGYTHYLEKTFQLSPKDARRFTLLMAAPVAVGGIQTNPVIMGVLNPIYSWLNGGISMTDSLKANPHSVPGKEQNVGDVLQSVMAYGIPARFTGMSPTSADVNPANLFGGGVWSRDAVNAYNFMRRIGDGYNQSMGALNTGEADPWKYLRFNATQGLKEAAAGSIPTVGRFIREETVRTEGKQISASGRTLNMKDIPEEERGKYQLLNALGLRTTQEDATTSQQRVVDAEYDLGTEVRQRFVRTLKEAYNQDRMDIVDGVIEQMKESGIPQKSINSTIKKIREDSESTGLEQSKKRFGKKANTAAKRSLRKRNPYVYQDTFEDDSSDESDNDE